MFPKPIRQSARCQRGFLMPLALFIVVALGGLALVISRTGTIAFVASVQESLSVQAFYAAESGAGYAMHRLLFDVSDGATADQRCAALQGQQLVFNAPGLQSCGAVLGCVALDSQAQSRVFEVSSLGRCGNGDLWAERSLVAAAYHDLQ